MTTSGPVEVAELFALTLDGPRLLGYTSSVRIWKFYFVLLFPVKLLAFTRYKSKSTVFVFISVLYCCFCKQTKKKLKWNSRNRKWTILKGWIQWHLTYPQWYAAIASACLCVQSCLTLHDSIDCSPPGSSVHGISQARILEWAAISFSRGASRPRDQTLPLPQPFLTLPTSE